MSEPGVSVDTFGQSLCDSCQNIRLPLGPNFEKHIHGYEKLASRAEHCVLCHLVRQGLRREFMATSTAQMDNCDMDWIDKEISDSVIYNNPFVAAIPGWVAVRGREGPVSVIDVYVSPRAHCVLVLSTELDVGPLLHDDSCMSPYRTRIHARTFEDLRDTWGSRELYYAKVLLWEDVRQHGKMESKLPARILDVGEEVSYDVSPSRGSQQVRLVEPNEGSCGAYMTLSHRWSSVHPITTTRSNIARHRQAIQWQDLSPTFREAIFVCRHIGVRYLWIDSLCIVQDDDVDWACQSKLMGDIYHNSICTIACHAAENNNKGFLSRTFAKSSVIVHGEHGTAFRASLPSEFSRAVVYNSVLNWRGWILQERLMSTRIIHFMKSQMYFESQGNNVISLDTMASNYLDTTPGILSTRLLNNAALFNKQQGQWHIIVEWYSYCSLTLEKDKLPALAGIATTIQRKTHDDYYAGIWGQSFYEDLLWVVADGLKSRRPMLPRVPSWSWASLDGAVIYLSHRSKDGDEEYIQNTIRNRLDMSGVFIRRPNRGQLCRVSDQKIHNPPLWIDTPCSLRFVGLPRKLCRLGKRSQASSDPTQMHKNITTVVSQYHKLMKTWFRLMEMDGDVIGLVVLDFEFKEETEQQPLWYFEIGFDAYAHCVLVVSKSSHHSTLYKREGLGFICHDRKKEKGYDCNLCQDLGGSNGCQELEEFALI